MKRIFLLFALVAAAPIYARVIPAVETAAAIPDAPIVDSGGNDTSLRSLLAGMGGGPVVILPIYTRCAASCPFQTQKLKQVWTGQNGGAPLRVILFSFDPQETTESIARYREREGAPESWAVVRGSADAARRFFDFFHYTVIDEQGQLIHPDQVFLLDPSLQWRFTVDGLNWTPREMGQALDQVRSPGVAVWMRTHPDLLAWVGFLCLLFGVAILGVWLVRQKSTSPPLSA